MQTAHNETTARPFAGLYLRTRRRMRFWGWSSRGWQSLRHDEAEHPLKTLAEWLRQAHERLDGSSAFPAQPGGSKATASTQEEPGSQLEPQNNRKFQFVCNRHMIGWIIR